jgi:hypothetical protein
MIERKILLLLTQGILVILPLNLVLKKDGQLKALYINAVLNTGAYASYGPDVIAVLGTTKLFSLSGPKRPF